jgi:hypothetical protein
VEPAGAARSRDAPCVYSRAVTTPRYRKRLRSLLTPAEARVFARLDTPQKLQVFIEKLPPNFELKRESTMSPRRVLATRTAHCSEAAIFAVAVFVYHGQPSWLVDLCALPTDDDHVVTLFKQRGLWGAISKVNHAVLRWRDPIYRSPRELVMSYAHEYNLNFGKKSLLTYSRPFSLARYAPARWVTAPDDLDWILGDLDASPHLPLAPKRALDERRRMTRVELKSQDVTEWPVPRARRVAHTK